MLLYGVAFGVFAHLLFWGAGLAVWCLPGRRPFWPALAFPAGIALQSTVVWLAAQAGWRGTDHYALAAESIPVLLLATAWWRRAGRIRLASWAAISAVSLAVLAALLVPLALAAKGLTTASLGGCDAADYAAGARVLQEFARGDRSGFLGLTEVVRVGSVDNFFDFWLRLNHFTPSALIAFQGSIFHCSPPELTGLLPAVILAGSVGTVFWVARALFRFRPAASLLAAGLYGFSPLAWYAVYQVAIGQLIAALGIGWLTWAALEVWRSPARSRRGSGAPALFIACSLLLGAYNFILLVALAPAAGCVLLDAGRADWRRRLGPWMIAVLWPLAAAGIVWWRRVAGLAERFRLFQTYDFGWRIPALTPEGWLGAVRAPGLDPLELPQRIIFGAILLLPVWSLARKDRRQWAAPLGCAFPVLIGYAFLLARGATRGTNASYDAYKLLAVFFPVLLPAVLAWLPAARAGGERAAAYCAVVAALGATLVADLGFARAMAVPPLIVDRDLLGVRRVESMSGVDSLNQRVPRMWERLWANALLLRRPQYFATHTYEGRRDTPLRGEWDLNGGLLTIVLPPGDSRTIDAHYSLARVGSAAFLRAQLGRIGESADLVRPAGWFDEERTPRSSLTWRWTGDEAWLALENPHPYPLRVRPTFELSSLRPRVLEVWDRGRRLASAAVPGPLTQVVLPEIELAPGTAEWSIRPVPAAEASGPGDARRLGFQVQGVALEVRR